MSRLLSVTVEFEAEEEEEEEEEGGADCTTQKRGTLSLKAAPLM